MDLYDDLDTKQTANQIDGWSSSIKMLQTQLAVKKATLPLQKREIPKKFPVMPVLSIRPKPVLDEDSISNVHKYNDISPNRVQKMTTITQFVQPVPDNKISENDWDVVDEYDPLWPNEYERLTKTKREKEDKRSFRKDDRERKRKSSSRFGSEDKYSGFPSRTPEEDSYSRSPPFANSGRVTGAAIAPPPSLQDSALTASSLIEEPSVATIPYASSSVAAKIMAKYGFKDGQGLGKQEQGMSMALQVEKTSKRGGRIIHEKELINSAPTAPQPPSTIETPNLPKSEPSITEIMKSPSKVVLLRNMVGPGDVDSELEPEVKDECNTKYGEVITVVIHEIPNEIPEEAVRIFVEFKRIESAIKAVVDLNGRFFGGKQVRAGFYSYDKFSNKMLDD